MPKVNPHADPTRRDLGPAALGRTVKKLFSYYPVLAPVTFVCILFSSIVSSVPSLFTQNIIQIIEKWYVSRDALHSLHDGLHAAHGVYDAGFSA